MAILTLERRGRRSAAVRVAMLVVALASTGASRPPSAREVQAAFLCSFPQFVEWPGDSSESPMTIAVFGDDSFAAIVAETARQKPDQERALVVRRVEDLEEARTSRIVFIGVSQEERVADLLGRLRGASVLTVSDAPDFASSGGVIGFVVEEHRVRFEINLAAAKRSDLRISSRLLNLARLVGGEPEQGG